MFYVFGDDAVSTDLDGIGSGDLAIGYVRSTDIDKVQAHFSLPSKFADMCKRDSELFHFDVERQDDCIFARLKIINPRQDGIDEDSLALFIRKNVLIIVDIHDTDGSIRDHFLFVKGRPLPSEATISDFALAFLEGAVAGDNKFIEQMRARIDNLEQEVLEGMADEEFSSELLNEKRILLFMHNYYEQLLDITEAFIYWHEDIFEPSRLEHFHAFGERLKRMIDSIKLLRDSVIQLRDAYNSSLEYELNKTMKLFTIMTLFFSPLTLITGWYGMNFVSMGELGWRHGYLIPVISCIAVTAVEFVWFRHKGWL